MKNQGLGWLVPANRGQPRRRGVPGKAAPPPPKEANMAYNNYTLDECVARLDELMLQPGTTFYQKWTCEKCGDRVTSNTPNKLFTQGYHEDCGHTTDIKKHGCNYMLHIVSERKVV